MSKRGIINGKFVQSERGVTPDMTRRTKNGEPCRLPLKYNQCAGALKVQLNAELQIAALVIRSGCTYCHASTALRAFHGLHRAGTGDVGVASIHVEVVMVIDYEEIDFSRFSKTEREFLNCD